MKIYGDCIRRRIEANGLVLNQVYGNLYESAKKQNRGTYKGTYKTRNIKER